MSRKTESETSTLLSEAPPDRRSRLAIFFDDPRVQMAAILVVSALIMLGHHFLYVFLDGCVVPEPGMFRIYEHSLKSSWRNLVYTQEVTSALGNLIANSAKVALTAVIGIAFVQVLWLHLRSRQYTISQIDAFVACSGNPFTPSSISTWRSRAFFLAIIALCSTLMTAITVLSPGSLTIPPQTMTLNSSCLVSNIDIAMGNFYALNSSGSNSPGDGGADQSGLNSIMQTAAQHMEKRDSVLSRASASSMLNSRDAGGGGGFGNTYAGVDGLVARIVVQGTYLPPISSQSCNPGNTCQYNIEFIAPAFNCTNTTVDFSANLPFRDNITSSDPVITVWNSTYTWDSGALVLLVTAAEIQNDSQGGVSTASGQAVSCTAHNATYDARITQGPSSSTVQLTGRHLHGVLPLHAASTASNYTTNQTMAMDALAEALAYAVGGVVAFETDANTFAQATSSAVRYSWVMQDLANGVSINLTSVIPMMMNDASISLLSASMAGSRTAVPYNTTCLSYASFYQYNRWRLISTYGACIFGAMVCALWGSFAVHRGGGESLGFERLLEAARILYTPEASLASKPLASDTKLKVTDGSHFEFHVGSGSTTTEDRS
ncbi:hypothetical protein FIBSPDRAFT_357395 [Athelia psychrophila]|uniref:Transmembrane protein n=1 Tax=Athelia psychrophila TaxID=1759441 RepID=A0A166PIL8_9AGAM|nr:hypothetical protein FIBSPDRAFT_357395 [Fibularhizoctonia sp. CBS 109695]